MKSSHKRFLCLLLTLVMICSLLPTAFAEGETTETAPATQTETVSTTQPTDQTPTQSATPAQSSTASTTEAPAVETKTEEETTPAEETKTEEETTPAEETKTEEETTPAEETKTEEETTPAEETKTEETTPAEETKTEEETTPAEETETEEEKSEEETCEHELALVPEVPATCIEGTKAYYECSKCGEIFWDAEGKEPVEDEADLVIPATDAHDLTLVPEVKATEEKDGNIAYWVCSKCGKMFKDNDGEPDLTTELTLAQTKLHNLTYNAEVDATCTTDGNIEYWQCTNCNKYFSDEKGKTEIYEEDLVINAYGHNPEHEKAIKPTCTLPGNYEYYLCLNCYKCFADEDCTIELDFAEDVVIPATGHDLKEKKAVAATCTKDGHNKYYVCKTCKEVFKDKNATQPTTKAKEKTYALGHAWSEWERKDDDLHAIYCVRCWESHVAAHVYETVTIDGVEHSVCSVCGCTKDKEDLTFSSINYYAYPVAKEGTLPYARFVVRYRDNPYKDDETIVQAFTAVFEKDGTVLKMDENAVAKVSIPVYLKETDFTLIRVDKDKDGNDVLTEIEATYTNGVLQFETETTGLFLIKTAAK